MPQAGAERVGRERKWRILRGIGKFCRAVIDRKIGHSFAGRGAGVDRALLAINDSIRGDADRPKRKLQQVAARRQTGEDRTQMAAESCVIMLIGLGRCILQSPA